MDSEGVTSNLHMLKSLHSVSFNVWIKLKVRMIPTGFKEVTKELVLAEIESLQ